jgi:hypothetical protein
MSTQKIVDAVSVPTACSVNSGARNAGTNVAVPIKLDPSSSSAMAQMMQQMAAANAAQAMRPVNPAEFVSNAGKRMVEAYTRYDSLLNLGRQLNGLSISDKLPASLQIEDISITFRTKDGDKVSDPKVASVKNVVCVGDISGLISAEMGIIILTLQQEIAEIMDIAKKSEEHYSKARKNWEETNPNRVIRPVGEQPLAETTEAVTEQK